MILFQLPLVLGESTVSPEFVNSLFFGFLKVLFVILGLIYVAFAVIIVRQIHVMQQSLVTSLAKKLKLLGYLHLILASLVVLFFVVSL